MILKQINTFSKFIQIFYYFYFKKQFSKNVFYYYYLFLKKNQFLKYLM